MAGQESSSIPESGIVIIDKPRGPSSHQVTAWVGEILGRRVGHAGTLDPQVSGVLIVMFGPAVRLAPVLLSHNKEYICLMRLHADASREAVERAAAEFVGRVYQRPPRKSAVKRSLRIRKIHEIEILEMEGRLVLFRVRCDAGTYIRTLCVHLGYDRDGPMVEPGGHVQAVRRDRCRRSTNLPTPLCLHGRATPNLQRMIHPRNRPLPT